MRPNLVYVALVNFFNNILVSEDTVDDGLRAEIEDPFARLGFERLEDWAGEANLEERVEGTDAIDPVVLEELRRRSE